MHLKAISKRLSFCLLVFGRPFVKQFAVCYPSIVCHLCCLSVTLVYCGQTVGWIKIKLGMEVGLRRSTMASLC